MSARSCKAYRVKQCKDGIKANFGNPLRISFQNKLSVSGLRFVSRAPAKLLTNSTESLRASRKFLPFIKAED
jgi:hypothetical protein